MADPQLIETAVSIATGEVQREIFVNEDVFDQEMERIFKRSWLFLCHETQIPERGDFFEAPMGQDNVLVVRQKDGSIKALMNSCSHRGNAVCRAEEGNARSFLCTYHGWSFGIDGTLKGVPGHKTFYHGDLDKSQLGLDRVAQVDTYHGFVFGTFDPDAPALPDFLGSAGRLAIDGLAAQGDLVAVAGVQKFVIDCNWKYAQDNLFDWYHPQISHASAFAPGVLIDTSGGGEAIDNEGVEMEDGNALEMSVGAISGTRYAQSAVIGEFGHGVSGPTASSPGNTQGDNSWRETERAKEWLGPVGNEVAGHGGVFPTLWIVPEMLQISLRVPRSPTTTEMWWFSFVDKGWDEGFRRKFVRLQNRTFGAAGLLEQDDGENWAQAMAQTNGLASRDMPVLVNMGLGHGDVIKEDGISRIDTETNEHSQLWLYNAWQQWMKDLTWDELRAATEPPERL